MSLVYIEFLIPIIIFILAIVYIFSNFERKYFKWVQDHWFYKRSTVSRLSSSFFYIGLFLMLLSILDLRGPEKKIDANVSKQETMILIDSSASMLAEDVRPNRFKKAIILAKHYVKKAVGQHISVTVFSDEQKKIIPYTNDIDLIEARLTGLENLDLTRGGTGLKLALQESVSSMKAKNKVARGNILVITDAENNSDFGVINIQEDINVAVVGVGTVKGAVIPLRDKKGNFRGNKKHSGKEVVTKLDENFMKSLSSKIKNFKYWTASSYSLPTEEILDFFNDSEESANKKDTVRIRPVLANYLIIPAVILIILSYMLKNLKTFVIPLVLVFSFSSISKEVSVEEKKEKKKSETITKLENKLKQGDINQLEKRKLANELLKEKFSEDSSKIYRELIKGKVDKTNKEDYFNLGASELLNKNSKEGLRLNKKLYDYLEKNEPNSELLKKTKMNMLKAIVQQKQQEQKKKEEQKKENQKKKNEDQNKDDQQKGDKKKEKSSENKKNSEQSKDNKEGSKGDETQKEGKNGDQQKNDDLDSSKEKEEKEQKSEEENDKDPSEDKSKKKEDMKKENERNNEMTKGEKKKLPALLKQLMNDDNQLQRKVIDAATTKRGSAKKKDW